MSSSDTLAGGVAMCECEKLVGIQVMSVRAAVILSDPKTFVVENRQRHLAVGHSRDLMVVGSDAALGNANTFWRSWLIEGIEGLEDCGVLFMIQVCSTRYAFGPMLARGVRAHGVALGS